MRLWLLLQLGLCCRVTGWGATLRASVVEDDSGHAILSAEMQIAKLGVAELVADIESDGNGKFEPVDLEDGDYVIRVLKANYIQTNIRMRAGSLGEGLLIRLVRCGSISGRVTDLSGAPVANAFIFALGGTQPVDVVTDANGEYRFFGLKPGKYRIAAAYGQPTQAVARTGEPPKLGPSGSGVAFYPEELSIVSGDEHVHIDFSLAPSALFRVSGRVDAQDIGTGDFWVALAPVKSPEIASSVAIAGNDGSFHFEGIRPGSFYLFVSGPSQIRSTFGAEFGDHGFFGRTQIEVTGRDVEGLSVRVARGLTLPIAVKGGDGCSAKAQVTASAMEDWAAYITRSANSKDDGNVVLMGLAPARYRVQVNSERCFQASEVIADLSSGTVKAVGVKLSRGGSIYVHVLPSVPVLLSGEGETRIEMSDAEGKVKFDALPPGHYRLGGSQVDLKAGEVREIELDLRKPEEK
jgi:protocatechuate 3,4-dioxygenase beta subunit